MRLKLQKNTRITKEKQKNENNIEPAMLQCAILYASHYFDWISAGGLLHICSNVTKTCTSLQLLRNWGVTKICEIIIRFSLFNAHVKKM